MRSEIFRTHCEDGQSNGTATARIATSGPIRSCHSRGCPSRDDAFTVAPDNVPTISNPAVRLSIHRIACAMKGSPTVERPG